MKESLQKTTPGHLRRTVGWLGNAIRRLSLSMILSIVFHLAVVSLVALSLMYTRDNPSPGASGVTVNLVDFDDLSDTSAEPVATGGNMAEATELGVPSLAEDLEQQMQRDTEHQFEDTSEKIVSNAERLARDEAARSMAEREADYAREQAAQIDKVAGLVDASTQEASKTVKQAGELKESLERAAKLRKEAMAGSFYGVAPGKAGRIIYVVDHSSSMEDAFGGVQLELKRTVSSMTEKKFFHLIFFTDGQFQEMPARTILRASKAHKNAAKRFIDSIKPGGGTDPKLALDRAFKLRPDLIYLLTDGQFDEDVVTYVQRLNNKGRKVTVNTICFGYHQGEDVLKSIATQNSGKYRFIK